MGKSFFFIFLFFSGSLLSCSQPQSNKKPELVIYTYESFLSEDGPGSALFPIFEKKCDCKIRALASGDGGQILSRVQLDAKRGKPKAHLVLGIDQHLWTKIRPYVLQESWEPRDFSLVKKELKLGAGFIPFDYGVFALMADGEKLREKNLPAPKRLSDLLKPVYKRNILIQDPRTSPPGLNFLLFTYRVLGGGTSGFWKDFKKQWLTLAPGWNDSYGLFLKGEAPLVWSYTTSQAYHRENGDSKGRYRALVFEEGNPYQIEGAAILKNSVKDEKTKTLARGFLEFLISKEAQEILPTRNWMLPARMKVKTPASFQGLPKPKKLLKTGVDSRRLDEILKRVEPGGSFLNANSSSDTNSFWDNYGRLRAALLGRPGGRTFLF